MLCIVVAIFFVRFLCFFVAAFCLVLVFVDGDVFLCLHVCFSFMHHFVVCVCDGLLGSSFVFVLVGSFVCSVVFICLTLACAFACLIACMLVRLLALSLACCGTFQFKTSADSVVCLPSLLFSGRIVLASACRA